MDILRWEGKLAKKHGLPVYQKVNAGSGAEDRYFIRLKTGKLIPYARFLWTAIMGLKKCIKEVPLAQQPLADS